MRNSSLIFVALVVVAAWPAGASAQCSRTGSGGRSSASGAISPINRSVARSGSAAGVFNPLSGSARARLAALQVQAQLAQLQNLALQREYYARSLQRLANDQGVAVASSLASPTADNFESDAGDDRAQRLQQRRARIRQQNAAKAFASAEKSELNGRRSTAQDYYRRVVRILPESDEMRVEAVAALNRLATHQ